ncbi:MAG: serine--tRNA ligase [SAR324 cluster bacterium]|nr:serine--tRNA ligase [SAR324 cluster bacterium]
MLDNKLVKKEIHGIIKELLDKRRVVFDFDTFKYISKTLHSCSQTKEKIRAKRKLISKRIASSKGCPQVMLEVKDELASLKNDLLLIENEYNWLNTQFSGYLAQIPNLLDPSVPEGKDEANNKLIGYGETKLIEKTKPTLSHHEIAEKLDVLDVARAVKISKNRFSILTGKGAWLERKLGQFMLEHQINQNGYREVSVPLLVNEKAMFGCGQLPKFAGDVYGTEDLFLIPTAEVPLTSMMQGEVLAESQLPLKLVALTPCFRREAGSYGKDTKGLIRQHQFYKVELVWLSTPEKSAKAHEQLLKDACSILDILSLSYRKMLLCAGDTGFNAAKCYDVEVYFPAQKKYREISSCSNCTDFQARRSNIRYTPKEGGKPRFVHSLNGSGLAVGRTLSAILENCQLDDGRIKLPARLADYLGGQEFL